MEDIRSIIARVAAGEPARHVVEAVIAPPMPVTDYPHGWKDSDASGSRLKVLYNPMPKYKRHIVRLDTKTGAWSHQGPGGYDVKGQGDLHGYLGQLHGELVREALDPDSAAALSPRGPKRVAAEPDKPRAARPKREPVDPALKKRAMDWNKYRTQNPEEAPEETIRKIHTTFGNHGWRLRHRPMPGVELWQHPDHPTHQVNLLHGGPERPQGAPEGPSWYHHDHAMTAHNSGYDSDSLHIHLGQFFGTHQDAANCKTCGTQLTGGPTCPECGDSQ